MSFTKDLAAKVKKHLQYLQQLRDRRIARATVRSRQRLKVAKTVTERRKIKLALEREKAATELELYEAVTATKKAKRAAEIARKEAGDLTFGERLSKGAKTFYKGLVTPPKRHQRITKKAKTRTRRA